MYTHLIHRSLSLRKYSCDSKEKGTRTLKAGQRTTIFVFNKIRQMAYSNMLQPCASHRARRYSFLFLKASHDARVFNSIIWRQDSVWW